MLTPQTRCTTRVSGMPLVMTLTGFPQIVVPKRSKAAAYFVRCIPPPTCKAAT